MSRDDHEMDALRERAESLCELVQSRAGVELGAKVTWFRIGADFATASAYIVDKDARKIGLNRDVVEAWLDELPSEQAGERFTALAFRAGASLVSSPPAYEWSEAVELHLRSEQDHGLDESYPRAFRAANQILEGHRIDRRLLDLVPDAGDQMAEIVRSDLEAHPTFDIYPRAAVVMGRPDLPSDLVQPAFDEFVERFGVEEAGDLTEVLSKYVALDADDVEGMIQLTAILVFQAFPEAMGLGWFDDDDADSASTDVWPFQARLLSGQASDWILLERFIAKAFTLFAGEAGLDYGNTLIIGLGENGINGPHVGGWSRSGNIFLQVVGVEFGADSFPELATRGWESFDNAPHSFHREVAVECADEIAADLVWLLRDAAKIVTTSELTLWGRGPAAEVAASLGWLLKPEHDDHELRHPLDPKVAEPIDHEELARLVRESLHNLAGQEPEEYEPGRFAIEIGGLEIVVLATDDAFPAIRFHHRVLEVPQGLRSQAVEFANALHGRFSTIGAHWWLGDDSLWQVGVLIAAKFDETIFGDQLGAFIEIAKNRTPEIRSRLGGSWPVNDS